MVEKTTIPKAIAPADMSKQFTTQVSKYLTYLLRHGAEKEGLTITSDGYLVLKDILDKP